MYNCARAARCKATAILSVTLVCVSVSLCPRAAVLCSRGGARAFVSTRSHTNKRRFSRERAARASKINYAPVDRCGLPWTRFVVARCMCVYLVVYFVPIWILEVSKCGEAHARLCNRAFMTAVC